MKWMKGWVLLGICVFACSGNTRKFGDPTGGSAGQSTQAGTGGSSTGGKAGGSTGGKAGGGESSSGDGGTEDPSAGSGAGGETEPGGANGLECGKDADCASSFCRDGVCCATECEGSCTACAEEFTGKPSGSCEAVQSGLDPRDECEATAPEGCGTDGGCNGEGACRNFGENQVCGAAACDGSTYSASRTCDGSGTCAPATTTDCGVHPCKATGCAAPCENDDACPEDSFCAVGDVCNAKKTDGETCGAAKECRSNQCVDGVCCESACATGCKACSKAKTGQTSGRCLAVPTGQDPDNECAVDQQNACGNDGTCNGSGACRVQPDTKSCGTASCSVSTLTPAGSCDGSGTCTPSSARACPGGTACASASACVTTCTKDSECAAGNFCNAGSCSPKKGTGVACSRVGECTSGFCVDGMCCGSACSLSCQGCSNAATGAANGTCAARTASATKPCPTANPTTCVNLQTDASNCSACGSVCSKPSIPNTVAACSAGACGAACSNPNYQICYNPTGTCSVASWGFEGGNQLNWHNSAENSVQVSSAVARTGTWSLESTGSSNLTYTAVAETAFCYNDSDYGLTDLSHKKLSAWVYLNSSYGAFPAQCRAYAVRDGFQRVNFAWRTAPPVNEWFQLTGTFGANESQIVVVGVECEVPADWFSHATKRWYLDDFSIQN